MYEEVHRSFISEETREDGSRAGSSRHKENEGRKRPATKKQPAGKKRSQAVEEGTQMFKLIFNKNVLRHMFFI